VRKPEKASGPVALVLALSATVLDERIACVLGQDTTIWSITAEQPHNDIMQRRADLGEFRRLVRAMLNDIKAAHGEHTVIHVFPVLPVSATVELGRVWMPKADLPLVIYDHNRTSHGFVRTIRICGNDQGESEAGAPVAHTDVTSGEAQP
jgi:SMODS-associated and fused to various effectors sensor domain